VSGAAADLVDILLFEVGDRLYGADATQVLRIGRRSASAPEVVMLGPLKDGSRALVVRGPEGEAELPVDGVRGVRRTPVSELRRRPSTARGDPSAVGFWLDGDTPVVLIDLVRALGAQGGQ
jgi:chemotaxis signal transduction protein